MVTSIILRVLGSHFFPLRQRILETESKDRQHSKNTSDCHTPFLLDSSAIEHVQLYELGDQVTTKFIIVSNSSFSKRQIICFGEPGFVP